MYISALENLLADISTDEDDDNDDIAESSENGETTSSDEGVGDEEEREEIEEREDAAQAADAVEDAQPAPVELVEVIVGGLDAHSEAMQVADEEEESEARRRAAVAALLDLQPTPAVVVVGVHDASQAVAAAAEAAAAAAHLQVDEVAAAAEEEEEAAVEEGDNVEERALNVNDRAREAEDAAINEDFRQMSNIEHLLATCTEPTTAATNILQRLMDRAADESTNIIEYANHPCVKRRQQILDFLARPIEPNEMRYRRSSGGLVTEHFFNQANPRDRQINELIRRGLVGLSKYPKALKQDITRIMYVRRAQEIRWFFNACKDNENSVLLDTENLPEVFHRLSQSFSGPPEE